MRLRAKNPGFAGRNCADAGEPRFTPVPERAQDFVHRPIHFIGRLRRLDTALFDDFPYQIRFLHRRKSSIPGWPVYAKLLKTKGEILGLNNEVNLITA